VILAFGLVASKVFGIICLSSVLTMSVPDVGYSRNAPCSLNYV